jgi:hypothetical protein
MAASKLYFLEELKGIEAGREKVDVGGDNKTLEGLLDAYTKFEYELSNETKLNAYLERINYTEKDITDLVHWLGVQEEIDRGESQKIGFYIGFLISILTEKNEKKGKRTIINIEENRLDRLGWNCKKFDVIKIGVNYGNSVFCDAKGNLLYVERCEGDNFAHDAKVKKIVAREVNGDYFAGRRNFAYQVKVREIIDGKVKGWKFVDSEDFAVKVSEIIAREVNGDYFAIYAKVEKLVVGELNGEKFAYDAKVDQMVINSKEAKQEYEKAMKEIADLEAKNDNC